MTLFLGILISIAIVQCGKEIPKKSEQEKITFEQAARQELKFTKDAIDVLRSVKGRETAANAIPSLRMIGKEVRKLRELDSFRNITSEKIEQFHREHKDEIATINKRFRAELSRLSALEEGPAVIREFINQIGTQPLDQKKEVKLK